MCPSQISEAGLRASVSADPPAACDSPALACAPSAEQGRWIEMNRARDLLCCGKKFFRNRVAKIDQRTVTGEHGGRVRQLNWDHLAKLAKDELGIEIQYPKPRAYVERIEDPSSVWDLKRLASDLKCSPSNVPRFLFPLLDAFETRGHNGGRKIVFPAEKAAKAKLIVETEDALSIPGLSRLVKVTPYTLHTQVAEGCLGDPAKIREGRVFTGRMQIEKVLPFVLYRYSSALSAVVEALNTRGEIRSESEYERWSALASHVTKIVSGKTHYKLPKAYKKMGFVNLGSKHALTFFRLGVVYLQGELYFPKESTNRHAKRRAHPDSYPLSQKYLANLLGMDKSAVWHSLTQTYGLPPKYYRDQDFPRDLIVLAVTSLIRDKAPKKLPQFYKDCSNNLYGMELLGYHLARYQLAMRTTKDAMKAETAWAKALASSQSVVDIRHIDRYLTLLAQPPRRSEGLAFDELTLERRKLWITPLLKNMAAFFDRDYELHRPPSYLRCSHKELVYPKTEPPTLLDRSASSRT